MNLPTLIGALVILAIVAGIVTRALYNKKHHKSSCSCGCSGCAGESFCHPRNSRGDGA